jgi:hypothetical protein
VIVLRSFAALLGLLRIPQSVLSGIAGFFLSNVISVILEQPDIMYVRFFGGSGETGAGGLAANTIIFSLGNPDSAAFPGFAESKLVDIRVMYSQSTAFASRRTFQLAIVNETGGTVMSEQINLGTGIGQTVIPAPIRMTIQPRWNIQLQNITALLAGEQAVVTLTIIARLVD